MPNELKCPIVIFNNTGELSLQITLFPGVTREQYNSLPRFEKAKGTIEEFFRKLCQKRGVPIEAVEKVINSDWNNLATLAQDIIVVRKLARALELTIRVWKWDINLDQPIDLFTVECFPPYFF